MTLGYIGESKELSAVVSPPDATNKTISWNSSDTAVAVVEENGRVTSVGPGRTIVSVNTDDGRHSASCMVTVYIMVNGISLDTTAIGMDSIGASYNLIATVLPAEAFDKSVWWSSEDASIARVNSSGKVTAMSPGISTITATSNEGGYTADCIVTVSRSPNTIETALRDMPEFFPNPFIDELRVMLPENHEYNSLQFIDMKGAVLYSEQIPDHKSLLILSDHAVLNARPGVYSINLSGPGGG